MFWGPPAYFQGAFAVIFREGIPFIHWISLILASEIDFILDFLEGFKETQI